MTPMDSQGMTSYECCINLGVKGTVLQSQAVKIRSSTIPEKKNKKNNNPMAYPMSLSRCYDAAKSEVSEINESTIRNQNTL